MERKEFFITILSSITSLGALPSRDKGQTLTTEGLNTLDERVRVICIFDESSGRLTINDFPFKGCTSYMYIDPDDGKTILLDTEYSSLIQSQLVRLYKSMRDSSEAVGGKTDIYIIR
ncbi:MAG: hypothetical protein QW727_01530 [Candidatus Pacearchaeota archaeon]